VRSLAREEEDLEDAVSHLFIYLNGLEAMEGAYPNDPNRSILSLNKRPKGEIPQSAIVA
jgi:hypothetical protein